jgi:hypothetical protein
MIIATGLAMLAVCSATVFLASEYPGDMPSSYRATDHDRRLTPIAREAIPIIEAIDRYDKANGHCPRVNETDAAKLRNSLPGEFVVTLHGNDIEFRAAKTITGWSYYSGNSDPTTCQLSRKLGWDPDLVWRRHEDRTKWIFAPGDGSADTVIDLYIGR